MTTPNASPDDNHPDLPDTTPEPETPKPDPALPEPPDAPRYVRCPMLGCGRLHEVTDL
ncbi:hypothetical protein ACRWOO_24740 [Streptomyces sp. NEAU-PBA10]|uniref:hypothetical protein n=1 Tax=Streptomyces TaxID=1883 RepID=UPI000A4C8430|nr:MULTISPECIES: hypothetical protein [Streptomyces]MCR0988577.1 hypothetical protein [Streptomyces albidoflavus]